MKSHIGLDTFLENQGQNVALVCPVHAYANRDVTYEVIYVKKRIVRLEIVLYLIDIQIIFNWNTIMYYASIAASVNSCSNTCETIIFVQ